MAEVEPKKKRTFRKFTCLGVDLDQLPDIRPRSSGCSCTARAAETWPAEEAALAAAAPAQAGEEAPPTEKPQVEKTPLLEGIISPEMRGSVVGSQRPDLQPGGNQP
ncbi:hypothetical protein J1605_006392 [Eschrichtius robustus]|uniref:40S ribosomal protein S15 n=1 Tax=Eschrichtius robustus TaxID=9764 RepID=A0AB34GQN3_ESCRO|nr:hypothetical protein J1605_010592 [Eschrichtius robustus]KAJ8786417.1 hypothetical protein J1605_006392 [Eschrichtius robustus]